MSKPTNMEMRAIKAISTKKTRDKIKDVELPTVFILSMYHKTGRKSKFDDALNQTLDESKEVLKQIDSVINLTKKQLKKYGELKKSILYHDLKKKLEA